MTQTCPVFPRGPLNPAGPVRLVCLPFAGGNATAYASLERALADIAEVRVPELPGRGTRFGEAFATDLPTVAAEIAGAPGRCRRSPSCYSAIPWAPSSPTRSRVPSRPPGARPVTSS
ncbi:thioesterase domain-containing protein [Methylobacterium sp. 37f]|uniref:thioesterase II family protein n=1 Tax=Methylobacterium sp. 37f TaxID=2817058 RepID=UPI0024949529|nr:thioesterase domain-containing protein [Methylobacterium sp. 37f]MCK2056759.1 hypothetical protein [Methylobacterium sp. 37f]